MSDVAIVPWLSVSDAGAALAYYRQAFGAEEVERLEDDSGGVVVAQLSIEGARFWIQQEDGFHGESPVRMLLIVTNPDAFFDRAVAAGATVVAAMHEEHGWRSGRVTDPFGHGWELCKQLGYP